MITITILILLVAFICGVTVQFDPNSYAGEKLFYQAMLFLVTVALLSLVWLAYWLF